MGGFAAVYPKTDCPHCVPENIKPLAEMIASGKKVTDPCTQCQVGGEVWLCLTCAEVHCSRYVEGHMALHNASEGHPLVFSFADFSYWCYICDSYVIHATLNHHKEGAAECFYKQKFGAESDADAIIQKMRESKHEPKDE
ncbi:hypothetical protein FGO68_gene10125 [Halteria grandinella]|uniref:UBP-type domain-containing protein n=1 Tax=Halteria grandinella TaxID=5974 RepID=A0A8J8SY99_HALGN|nr:hypothetical protein FGO68_gene10125 [Halteria grandinella]